MANDDKGQWRPRGRPAKGGKRPDRDGATSDGKQPGRVSAGGRDAGERDAGGRGDGRTGFRPRKPEQRPVRNVDIKVWRATRDDAETPRRPSLEERTRHLRPKRDGEPERKPRAGARDRDRPASRGDEPRGYVARDDAKGRRPRDGIRVDRHDRDERPRRQRDGDRSPRDPRSERTVGKPRAERPGREDDAAASVRKAGAPTESMRISKAMARAGLCSRRDGERWIEEGRVSVNGTVIDSPALDVGPTDRVLVDGQPLPPPEPVRLWRYHKPKGLVTTHADPEGRDTVFATLPADMPRVISVGRLDFNTEGLLLLTTSGAVARHLELPTTGWLRRYRVRAFGDVTQDALDHLKDGIEIEGVHYGPIEATLDSVQGSNVWLTIGLREGKNREVRTILASLGLDVNRLIRVSYGPFQLLELAPGTLEIVRRKVLAEQLGPQLAAELGLDGEADADEKLPPRQAFRVRPRPGGDNARGEPAADRRSSGYRARDEGERPARGDKAPYKGKPAFGEQSAGYSAKSPGDRQRGERSDRGDRPARGDKPPFRGKSAFRERPTGGYQAKTPGDRTHGERSDRSDRPARGDKPPFRGKSAFRDKPAGGYQAKTPGDDRPRGRTSDRAERPERSDKPSFRGKPAFRERPSGYRAKPTENRDRGERGDQGDRPARSGKPPFRGKPAFRDKPSGYRGKTPGDRERSNRSDRTDRPERGDKPSFRGKSAFRDKPSGFRARPATSRDRDERGGKPPSKGKPSGYRAKDDGDSGSDK